MHAWCFVADLMLNFGISTTRTSGHIVVSRTREQWRSKFGAIHQYMSAFLVCGAVRSRRETSNVQHSINGLQYTEKVARATVFRHRLRMQTDNDLLPTVPTVDNVYDRLVWLPQSTDYSNWQCHFTIITAHVRFRFLFVFFTFVYITQLYMVALSKSCPFVTITTRTRSS